MKDKLKIIHGNKDQFIKEKSDELLFAVFENKDLDEARRVIESVTPRGELQVVPKQQEPNE